MKEMQTTSGNYKIVETDAIIEILSPESFISFYKESKEDMDDFSQLAEEIRMIKININRRINS